MHYRAFISHSHADSKFAAWLQRAIETWRVPTRLRSELGYSRVKPVFLDRTDLRAATNLGYALEDALRNSSALIVVCSNEAADSDWVDQEIARYRQFNPDAPILPIIASGEPPHCFPEPLLLDAAGNALEPLAADARKGFDGRRDALLKTIAGIIDVDFDVLKQRDFRRRQQKMGAVAALSTAIAAVTLYLAYVAYEARDDANRRREQADDLIAFMLGDLREKLEPIGKLEVLDSVGDAALDYFAGFDPYELTFDVALKNAVALRQLAEVEVSKSRYTNALQALAQAEALLAELEAENPSSADLGEQRYLIEYWIGLVNFERSQWESARARWQNYMRIAKATYDASGDQAHLIEYLYSQQNLGVLELSAGNLDVAGQHLADALAELDSGNYYPVGSVPYHDFRSTLLSWSGEVAWTRGELAGALNLYQQQYEAIAKVRETDDAKLYEELALQALARVAMIQLLTGRVDDASKSYREAYLASRQLVEFDGENTYWLRLLTTAGLGYSRALHAQGELAQANTVNQQMELQAQRLLSIIPLSAKNAEQYVQIQLQTAILALCESRSGTAQKAIVASKDVISTFDNPESLEELFLVRVLSELLAADTAALTNDDEEAQRHLENARRILEQHDQRLDPVERVLVARLVHEAEPPGFTAEQDFYGEREAEMLSANIAIRHLLAGGHWGSH